MSRKRGFPGRPASGRRPPTFPQVAESRNPSRNRVAVTADQLDVARARLARGESVTAIAAHLGVGRSTLYRALERAGGSRAWVVCGNLGARIVRIR